MNPSSIDIRNMLEEYGESSGQSSSAGVAGIDIWVGREPSEPKNVITIFDTLGFPPAISIDGVTGYEYPGIQIRVRNRKYEEGWAIIEEIKTALHGRHEEVWNGTLYSAIICSSGPALLDWDDNGNVRFIINFNLQRRVA